uniref:ER membrane protein complex subunit 6 n=1 Tax=Caenorhabditis japonica TaxID=281687 RepID=A0A8R1E9B0_CAEJA
MANSQKSPKHKIPKIQFSFPQVLSLFVGLIFGFTPMTGILGIISYVIISSVVAQHYVVKFQKVDEEEVGGFWELSKEGFGAAFATYMVTWITVYTSTHA